MTAIDQRPARIAPGTAPAFSMTDPDRARRMVETLSRFAVEITRAQRPVSTLSQLVTPEILAMLQRRADLTRRLRGIAVSPPAEHERRTAVRGVRVCMVSDEVVEASAVICERDRARFIAMRWELRPRTGWKVTVLELG